MAAHRVPIGITSALFSVIVLGCAGPAAKTGVGLANGGGSSSALTNGLCGTWQGELSYVGSDHQS